MLYLILIYTYTYYLFYLQFLSMKLTAASQFHDFNADTETTDKVRVNIVQYGLVITAMPTVTDIELKLKHMRFLLSCRR